MIYAYDMIVNFCDSGRVLEFYEWKDNDKIDHIKKIPLFRIGTKDLVNLFNNKVNFDKEFLDIIYKKTLLYKNKEIIDYACLFSDGSKVLAIEFTRDGEALYKSRLLLDEEDDICEEVDRLDITDIKVNIVESILFNNFLTREEVFIQKFLLVEFDNLYSRNEVDKFNYFYEEVFSRDKLSFNDKYNKIKDDIMNNFNYKYNLLYNLVRISYSNK